MLGAGGTDEGFIADCKQLSHSLETVYSGQMLMVKRNFHTQERVTVHIL